MAGCCLLAAAARLGAQSPTQQGVLAQPPQQKSLPKEPVLKLRPPPKPGEVHDPPGRIRLDVTVTNAAGIPVAGLGEPEFQLLDNGRPQKIVSLRASDSDVDGAGYRTSILLVIDAVNAGATDISSLRADAEQFLRQNGGHLAQPVTVLVLTDTAYHVLGRSSLDGNALAQAVHDFKLDPRTNRAAAIGVVQRYQVSLRAISILADREVDVPGRKMMIWMGPGWPVLPDSQSSYDTHVHTQNFDALAMLTNQLREGRMVLCSAGGGPETLVREFLRPVKSEWEMAPGNLALQVIAVHSGGNTFGAAKNGRVVEMANACMRQVGAFYSLVFDAPASAKVFTYHALKVTVAKPGLTVHTNAGYYSEP